MINIFRRSLWLPYDSGPRAETDLLGGFWDNLRDDGGLGKVSSSGRGQQELDSGHILEVETTEFPVGLESEVRE